MKGINLEAGQKKLLKNISWKGIVSMLSFMILSIMFNMTVLAEHEYDAKGFAYGISEEIIGYQPADGPNDNGYYEISNAGQLFWFANQVNNVNAGINAVLTNDIVINEGTMEEDSGMEEDSRMNENSGDDGAIIQWIPIGKDEDGRRYVGTFDGQNHTISGLYFSDNIQSNVGLFGCIGKGSDDQIGTVKNVGVINSYIKGHEDIGGVVGYNLFGTVSFCYSVGNTVDGNFCAGGVVGLNKGGEVRGCCNEGNINRSVCVGGVVGWNIGGIVKICNNTGNISGKSCIGGIVGYNCEGTVEKSYNEGIVLGGKCDYVGGIVGNNISGKMILCDDEGDVIVCCGFNREKVMW